MATPDGDLYPLYWGSSSCNFTTSQCTEIGNAIEELQNRQLEHCRSLGAAAWDRFTDTNIGFKPGNETGGLAYVEGSYTSGGYYVTSGDTSLNQGAFDSMG